MLLGQESTDDATIGAGSSWLSFSDLFRIADSLTEIESFALRRAILHGHDINRIAEELEISRADASSLLECAKEKMTSEITAKGLGRRAWSRREKVDRFAERRSPSLKLKHVCK